MSFIKLTDHAKQRGARRYGMPPVKLAELAEKAITDGYSYGDAPNEKIGRYLKSKARENKAYAWSGYIFILNKHMVLITTFRMPRHLLLTLERKQTYIGVNE